MSSISFSGLLNSVFSFPILGYGASFLKDSVISVMRTGPVPKHVALIMDGNRTYAQRMNLPLRDGHNAGAESLVSVLDVCFRLGVHHVTIYAFSIENFNRSQEEIDTLFEILRDKLELLSLESSSFAQLNKIKIKIIGDKALIPEDILKDLEDVEERTKNSTSPRVLNVCFPYTSRDEITHSIREIATKAQAGEIQDIKNNIDLKLLHDSLYMGEEAPPLDLLIRTSGHTRLSDFMLWQCNENCTIEFVKTLWPDFKFLGITSLILKWMYYKTLQLDDEENDQGSTERKIVKNILQDLPHPPNIVSVTERG